MHVVLKIFDKMRIASAKFLSRSPIALTTSPSQATPPQHCNVVMAKELFGSHQLVDPIPFIHSESHRAHRREDKSRTIVHGLAIRCESGIHLLPLVLLSSSLTITLPPFLSSPYCPYKIIRCLCTSGTSHWESDQHNSHRSDRGVTA